MEVQYIGHFLQNRIHMQRVSMKLAPLISMMTTADFARKNWLAHFICGGLNFQIEHHLFPKICHIHYPHISHIVQETAEEFGVPFLDNPSFSTAMASHYRFMKAMGSGENPKILAAV